jgi:hypothetical protein
VRPRASRYFWRQPSCRLAGRPHPAVPGCLSAALGAPSPSAAGPPRVFVRLIMTLWERRTLGSEDQKNRARSGHQNRTAILSYREHGRSRAIAQERTSSRFSPPAKRGTEEALSLNGDGSCGFRFPQCPAGAVDHGWRGCARREVARRALGSVRRRLCVAGDKNDDFEDGARAGFHPAGDEIEVDAELVAQERQKNEKADQDEQAVGFDS